MKPAISTASGLRRGAKLSSGLFDELIVDNFAGGGGASRGIEAAVGRSVDIAINHDKQAVWTHQINHPHTRHLCESVFDVDPMEATAGRPVGLAWFSPDCTHFSRAKGGKPVKKTIRALAWIVIRWARLKKPRVIILENVQEFTTWGPLDAEDRPCGKRKGQTFRRWVTTLRNLGYTVEWKVLNAADYGAPTHRKRFFLIARSDGLPIVWPEPTHGPRRQRPYRTAAECIDWSLRCPSIFLTKEEARTLRVTRPLAEKTMRRIAMGLKRYVLENPKPFIVRVQHGGEHFRGQSVERPLSTITGSHGHAVVAPFLAQRYGEGPHQNTRGQVVDRPLSTVTPDNNSGVLRFGLVAPHIVPIDNKSGGDTAYGPSEPLRTIVGENRFAVVAPTLLGTGGPDYSAKPRPADEPIGTVMAENHRAIAAAFLAKHYGGVVGHGPDRPLGTVTAVDHHSVVVANMLKFRGDSSGSAVDRPLPTITSGAGAERPAGAAHAMGVTAAHLVKLRGQCHGAAADEPAPTLTAGGNHIAEVRAFLMKFYGTGGQHQTCDQPLHTIPSVDRFGLVMVEGEPFQIIDIGMRMLEPRELLRAQFGKYAKDYVLVGPKWLQVKMIGNSVPPEVAEALVRANYTVEMEAAA